MDDKESTRWESEKDWVGWTIRDEIYGYVRNHLGPIAVGWVAGGVGALVAAIRSYPTVSYCLGTATLTLTLIVALALVSRRQPLRTPRSQFISGEKGFFDFMVNLGRSQKALVETLEKMTEVHTQLTARVRQHTVAFEQIKNRGDADMFDQMREEALRAARSTNAASDKFERLTPSFTESASVYFESLLGVVNHIDAANPAHIAQLRGIATAVASLRSSNAESRATQKLYLQSLHGARGFAQEFNMATDRMIREVQAIIRVMDDVEAHCNTATSAIELKLASIAMPQNQ